MIIEGYEPIDYIQFDLGAMNEEPASPMREQLAVGREADDNDSQVKEDSKVIVPEIQWMHHCDIGSGNDARPMYLSTMS